MVIELPLQVLSDGVAHLADVAVGLAPQPGKLCGAVKPEGEKVEDFLVFLAQGLYQS